MDLLAKDASPLQVYLQSKRILKHTSRARNADWYRDAADLNLQWHIWVGSQSISSNIFNKSADQWFEGPDLPPIAFEADENQAPIGLDEPSRNGLHDLLRRILATKEFGLKAKSLGIIFHLADSVRVRDLDPSFAAETNFEDVNELLSTAPEIALGDESVDPSEGNWRLLPLIGVQEGEKRAIAIQISGQYRFIVDELREYGELRNIPVITNVHAAPLEAMTTLPELFPEADFTNSLFLLQYESFTYLFATGSRKELLLVRPLVHRSENHLSNAEVSDLATTTAALLNIKNPTLFYISMTGMTGPQIDGILVGFRETHSNATAYAADSRSLEILAAIPGRRIEFWSTGSARTPPGESRNTFAQLKQRWAFQDFYGPSRDEKALLPSRSDLQLLKVSGLLQKAAIVGVIAFGGWTATDFVTKIRSDAWQLEEASATAMTESVTTIKKERREWEHWDNLLAKRSEGWLALEALLSIFPDNSGVILSSATYSASAASGESSDVFGLTRVWRMSGYANPEIATQLPTLGSRTRVSGMLNQIAEENQAPYLKVEGDTRTLDVSLAQKQGTMPSSLEFPTRMARHFRTSFDLRIEQTLSDKDELAINTKSLSSK